MNFNFYVTLLAGSCRPSRTDHAVQFIPAEGVGMRAKLLQVREQVVLIRWPEHTAVGRQDAGLTCDGAARGCVVTCVRAHEHLCRIQNDTFDFIRLVHDGRLIAVAMMLLAGATWQTRLSHGLCTGRKTCQHAQEEARNAMPDLRVHQHAREQQTTTPVL